MPSTLQNKKKLYSAILKLPEGYVEPMVLRYVKGQTSSRIAETMGISIESVDSRLLRAMSRMRGLLEDTDEQD
ncbi:MAG TPA: sigma-70 family RNA polymerase sigma factor [Sedimentisphaerales bacterium]|nr:sigma-70 family RNA polymerase sigma factor [Sedimentisphaerales bacterium]